MQVRYSEPGELKSVAPASIYGYIQWIQGINYESGLEIA